MLISIKQHLTNIWTSFHKNGKQHWGWVEERCCLSKKACTAIYANDTALYLSVIVHYMDVYVSSVFQQCLSAMPMSELSLCQQCFPLTYDLNSLYLEFIVTFYLFARFNRLSCMLVFFVFTFFHVTPYLPVAFQICVE